MKTWTRGCVVVATLALGGCDNGWQKGRLVGFIVNGQTGERLNFFSKSGDKNNLGDDGNSKSQVYAVIDGEFRRARPCGSGDLNNQNAIEADGCYQIDGIPEGQSFPLFAQSPGFERFVTELNYPLLDVDYEKHQYIGNIRLFPKDFKQDYRLLVSYLGQPVPQARVACQYRATNGNTLQVDGNFLQPQNTGSTTVVATTDAEGVALIAGAQLVNGARYRCESVVDQAFDGRVLSGDLEFTAGVSQPSQSLALSASGAVDNVLYAVSSNVDNQNLPQGATARLVVNFNRPVEIMPATVDCQQAAILTTDVDNDGNTARTITNVPNNNASETVQADLSADGLTLTVSLKTLERPFDPDDRGTSAFFSGIVLRPKAPADNRVVRYLGSIAGCPQAQVYGTEQPLRNLRTSGTQSSQVQVF